MFIVLLSSIVNAYSHTKFISISNQKCVIQPTLINLHSNEYNQEFNYYPFLFQLDRCAGSYNILNDVCVPNKTEDLNLSMFNMTDYKNKLIESINKAYIMRM